jgi:predicted helicase
MAGIARNIRYLIGQAYRDERQSGWLHNWLEAFKEVLIPDLKPYSEERETPSLTKPTFDDMLAQTLAYGFFAAYLNMPAKEEFTRQSAIWAIPKTNPFLRKLFGEMAGPDMPDTIAWAVEELVNLLKHTRIDLILKDFGKGKGKQDPVVHFYETFLAAYDPKIREVRGVYYTPEPVVSYIVRSIDHLLKARFRRPKGLADENTLILDPAVGTGTFLYFVIQHIYESLSPQHGAWNDYVARHLLNRVFGFELLMAPYAIAHLKLGMLLEQTGHNVGADQRLGIYLTNTLEEAARKSEAMLSRWISDEANAAAEIKRDKPILVVLGNPPYSGVSANKGPWITRLIQDYRKVDGKPLGEKKVWIKNDYVKFIRFGQWRIEQTGHGILAFITDHSYLESPTFRGMRRHLMKVFDEIRILNLHGSVRSREKGPSGERDENVFDIRQGVAIALFVKYPKGSKRKKVFYADLFGKRESKHKVLLRDDIQGTVWRSISPTAPFFPFAAVESGLKKEYQRGWSAQDIFQVRSNGVQTSRDSLVVNVAYGSLVSAMSEFVDEKLSDSDIRSRFFAHKSSSLYRSGDTREWNLRGARQSLKKEPDWRSSIREYLYRPFDCRFILYIDCMVDWPRRGVMRHLNKPNIALCVGRAGRVHHGDWDLVFCSSKIIDHNIFYRGSSLNFPLYLYNNNNNETTGDGASPGMVLFEPASSYATACCNLNPAFLKALAEKLGLPQSGPHGLPRGVTPEDILHYAYALFHSPTYRTRYADFLKIDYPRLPVPTDNRFLRALAKRGGGLVALHLMQSPLLDSPKTTYPVRGDNVVAEVSYNEPKERVWVNNRQYFEGVPPKVWEFHIGGYQVCAKWLKGRKGRTLTYDDIQHYQKVVVVLQHTIRLMTDIDEFIDSCGGWPIH